MNVVLFGATGMVGQGVLRECLLSPDVTSVLAVGRSPSGQTHAKLRDGVAKDLFDLSSLQADFAKCDACFFCLGVSSAGMSERDYTRITYDLTLSAARALVAANPDMTFIYVSGTGTDSTEKGSSMWARVKGKTENELFKLPFKAAYMFRPGFIQPMHGIASRTTSYRVLYALMWPFTPVLKALFPKMITTTEKLGRAMLHVAKHGAPQKLLENPDINALQGTSST